jgi:Flp pilus assembly protein TadG
LKSFLLNGEEGQSIVEFALLLPALMLITTGLLVFGVSMNNYLQLTNAVEVGARAAAIAGGITTDPCATASSAVIAAAPGLTPSKLVFTYSLAGNAESGTSCSATSVENAPAAYLSAGSTVTVTASYPLNLSVFGRKFSATNAVLKASATELVQ